MPSFKGTNQIIIQPNDQNRGFTYHCTTCTSATANDGTLPYGTTISGVTTVATLDGVVDTELVAATVLDTPDITVALDYPSINGAGRYSLTFILELSDSSTLELDFDRVMVKNL